MKRLLSSCKKRVILAFTSLNVYWVNKLWKEPIDSVYEKMKKTPDIPKMFIRKKQGAVPRKNFHPSRYDKTEAMGA